MKKLTTLLSKKFNELHLLVQQAESMDSLEIVAGGIEHLQVLLNKRTNQVKTFVSREESEKLLDSCLQDAFPGYRCVGNTLKAMNFDEDKEIKNIYTDKYLPFRTRDNVWLANYLRSVSYRSQAKINANQLCNGGKYRELKEISLADVENYISESRKFSDARNKYEQNVVANMTISQALKSKEGSASWFRRDILNQTREMGINQHNAAMVMEQDTRWRTKIFKNGFHDKINRHTFSLMVPNEEERAWLNANHFAVLVSLEFIEKQALECYNALSEYEYYRWEDTKKIIDELRLATLNMRMTQKEARSMYQKFEELCDKYIQELRICRKIIGREKSGGIEK